MCEIANIYRLLLTIFILIASIQIWAVEKKPGIVKSCAMVLSPVVMTSHPKAFLEPDKADQIVKDLKTLGTRLRAEDDYIDAIDKLEWEWKLAFVAAQAQILRPADNSYNVVMDTADNLIAFSNLPSSTLKLFFSALGIESVEGFSHTTHELFKIFSEINFANQLIGSGLPLPVEESYWDLGQTFASNLIILPTTDGLTRIKEVRGPAIGEELSDISKLPTALLFMLKRINQLSDRLIVNIERAIEADTLATDEGSLDQLLDGIEEGASHYLDTEYMGDDEPSTFNPEENKLIEKMIDLVDKLREYRYNKFIHNKKTSGSGPWV